MLILSIYLVRRSLLGGAFDKNLSSLNGVNSGLCFRVQSTFEMIELTRIKLIFMVLKHMN